MRTIVLANGTMVAAIALACSDSTGSRATAASLSVSPSPVELSRFDSTQLAVSVLDQQGAPILGVSLTFRSKDTSIAQVTNTGIVRSKEAIGIDTVTVSGDGLVARVRVVVVGNAYKVVVGPADTTIRQGGQYALRVRVSDSLGDTIPNPALAFSSGDSVVSTVTSAGWVLARTPGRIVIAVTSGNAIGVSFESVFDSQLTARVPYNSDLYGAAASSKGVVYLTTPLGSRVPRLDLTNFSLTDTNPIAGGPIQVTFDSAGGRAFVTNTTSNTVETIDVATHLQLDTFAVPGTPYPILVTPDGGIALVITNSGWLYKIAVPSGTRLDSLSAPNRSLHLAWGSGDSLLYFSTEPAGTVTEVRLSPFAVKRTFSVGGTPQSLAVSSDGSVLYVADELGPLRVWNLATATEIDTIPTGGGTFGVALSSGGSTLYAGTTLGYVLVVDPATRAVLKTVHVQGTPRVIAVDPVTGYAIIPNEAGWVDVLK